MLYYLQRPSSYEGFTQIIANDRGHLKQGVPRSKDSPWGGFVGTWEMPKKIPGNVTTYMSRGDPAIDNIQKTRAEHNEYMRQAVSPDKTLAMEPKVSHLYHWYESHEEKEMIEIHVL